MKHEPVWPPKYIVLMVLSSITKEFFCLRKNVSLYPLCMMVFIITSVSFLFKNDSLLVICAVILFKSDDRCLAVKERKSVTRRSLNYKKTIVSSRTLPLFILVFGFVTQLVINMFGLPRSRERWWIYLLICIF